MEKPLLPYFSEEESDFLWERAGRKEAQPRNHREREVARVTTREEANTLSKKCRQAGG